MANLKPSPSAPNKFAAGIRTSSKLIKRVGWAFQPIFSSALPYSIPLASAGTTNAEMPLGPSAPVRAITTKISVSPAPEINIFEPLITYSSPSRTALVFNDAASEPEPGSVKQYDASNSPITNCSTYLSFTASVPKLAIIQVAIL